ncbi:hypothetical protein HPB49_004175 [Dermacentor silvarum]|uniref:Uncharacterized protein n=1 Tax=Dermacentor silvarum TaxID=543639 RepID=A0ACB8CPS6_DERSI|nr:hypothetical protein HPB49_004175 [Dermacentor silvarum]
MSNRQVKHRVMSIEEKLDIINDIQRAAKKSVLARQKGLPLSTVCGIWAAREKVLNGAPSNLKRCRLRGSSYPDVEEALCPPKKSIQAKWMQMKKRLTTATARRCLQKFWSDKVAAPECRFATSIMTSKLVKICPTVTSQANVDDVKALHAATKCGWLCQDTHTHLKVGTLDADDSSRQVLEAPSQGRIGTRSVGQFGEDACSCTIVAHPLVVLPQQVGRITPALQVRLQEWAAHVQQACGLTTLTEPVVQRGMKRLVI